MGSSQEAEAGHGGRWRGGRWRAAAASRGAGRGVPSRPAEPGVLGPGLDRPPEPPIQAHVGPGLWEASLQPPSVLLKHLTVPARHGASVLVPRGWAPGPPSPAPPGGLFPASSVPVASSRRSRLLVLISVGCPAPGGAERHGGSHSSGRCPRVRDSGSPPGRAGSLPSRAALEGPAYGGRWALSSPVGGRCVIPEHPPRCDAGKQVRGHLSSYDLGRGPHW